MDRAKVPAEVSDSGSREPTVEAIMTARIAVVSESDSFAFAAQVLLWRRIRHLPVVDPDGNLVGLLRDRDLLRLPVDGAAGAVPVREAMRSPVATVTPECTVSKASAILVREDVDVLVVIRNGKPVGMVSTSDILAERAKRSERKGLTAADIMRRDLLVTHPGDSLASAVEKLVSGHVRHLPIVDDDYRVVGVLSDRDVRAAAGDPREAMARGPRDGFLSDVTVETLMRRKPIAIAATLGVLEIGDLLLRENVGAVPVVGDDDTLLGIVSYVDVLSHLIGYQGSARTRV
jgi:CBS domain-containing protein